MMPPRDAQPRKVIAPDMTAGGVTAFFVSLFVGGIVGGVVLVAMGSAVFGAGAMTGVILLMMVVMVGNLHTMEYRFFDTEFESYEGFLNISHNNISYDRVTDISFSRSVWERLFGVGTIKLNTAGGNMQEITISYIEQPERIYEEVRSIVWGGEQPGSRQPRDGRGGRRQQPQPRDADVQPRRR